MGCVGGSEYLLIIDSPNSANKGYLRTSVLVLCDYVINFTSKVALTSALVLHTRHMTGSKSNLEV